MMQKIYCLLDRHAKKRLVMLFLLMIIGSVMESFSISLVLVFIGLVNNSPSEIAPMQWVNNIYTLVQPGNHRIFLVWVGGIMLGIYIVKNLFLLFQVYFQNRFIYDQQAVISRNLLNSYLYSPYTFHLQRNSAELVRNLTVSMGTMFGSGVIPFVTFISELMVVISISILLIMVEPTVTISAMVILGGLTALFYKRIRFKVSYYGNRVQDSSAKLIMWANQSLGGIKEIKLFGRESFFLNSFANHRFDNARYNVFFSTVQRLPRLYLEVTLIAGILLITMVMTIRGGRSENLVPVVGLFAMASIRLMPSISQIVNSLSSMRFGNAAVNDVYEDMSFFRQQAEGNGTISDISPMRFSEKITMQGVTFTYQGSKTPTLYTINFSVSCGTSVAVVGPSGAGKTTLMDIILGLLRPEKGKLLVDGIDINQNTETLSAWQKNIGYIPQDIYLTDDSIRKNIAFGVDDDAIDNDRIFEVIQQTNLKDFIDSLPEGINTIAGERGVRLSGGQKQRIGIARALYHDPKVLMMDEATSSLDTETESEISRTIDELAGDKTIIIIAHRLSTVKKCSKLFFLKEGRIADSGTFEELINGNEDFRKMAQYSKGDVIA